MSVRARWIVAGLIVVAAAVIALWPRSTGPAAAPPAPDLGPARAKAALAGCPSGPSGGPRTLAGVRVQCLADGSAVDLASVFAGRSVLVNVWATWCQPCKEELPVLAEYAAGPGAVPVVGVATQSDAAGALELLSSLGVHFANVLDHDLVAFRALQAPDALPASYVIGSDGTVRFVAEPRLFRSVDAVRQAVSRYGGGST